MSATSGSLNPGQSITLTVSINSGANALLNGVYADTVSFTNTTSGLGNTTRAVSLNISDNSISITQAKSMPDGAAVVIKGKVVSALFAGAIYVQETNGTAGIRVQSSVSGIKIGDVVTVTGTLGTYKIDGVHATERQIVASGVIR